MGLRMDIKLRIPLPNKTEEAFRNKDRYNRREKYPKKLGDILEEAQEEQNELVYNEPHDDTALL